MLTSASSLTPLWNRAAEWERRLTMIRKARSFLYLSTYYLEPDRFGVELLELLLAAQRRGVAVNLLIDSFGQRLGGVLMSAEGKAALTSRLGGLHKAGATVSLYRPRWALQRWLGGGQHVKIQLSDAGEAIFGSSNITGASFERWNEYSVALCGPVVRLLLESYREIGGQVSAVHLLELSTGAHPDANLELEYWQCNPNPLQGPLGPLGWRGSNLVTDGLIQMLDSARASVAITSFYFKPVAGLLEALLRCARRGVKVEVYHSHRDALPATDLAWIAAAASYDLLLSAGVKIYENRRGEHSKIVLVDQAWVAFGSYNFEDAAHDRLAEAMLTSRDPRAAEPASRIFEDLRAHPDNSEVTARSLGNLAARVRLRRALFSRFKRWM